MKSSTFKKIGAVSLVLLISACASAPSTHRAPVVERGLEMKKPAATRVPAGAGESSQRPSIKYLDTQSYVVQKGDTLYSIAFSNGLDYRELAELNNIDDPSLIQLGQRIMLPSAAVANAKSEAKMATTPPPIPSGSNVKTQPRVGKIPYSESALAQAEKMQEETAKGKNVRVATATEPAADGDDELEWGMPAKGKIIAEFSESANRKGIDISGKLGQPVLASAAGKVVYSGSGLRGYGKLVIIKHNKAYLSAYAHNDQILVKEGQNVGKGQKIAEMGSSDSDQVKLHFEIRKFGKPVDPVQYLPSPKS